MKGFCKSAIAALLMVFSLSLGAATTLPAGVPSADDEEEDIYSGDLRCVVLRIGGEWVRVCM